MDSLESESNLGAVLRAHFLRRIGQEEVAGCQLRMPSELRLADFAGSRSPNKSFLKISS